jgi:hypothetical protein
MGEKIVIGPINKGLRTDRTAFVIDNDSFPTLINAYQWRGRVKRKRGTSLLNRLKRYFDSTSSAYSSVSTITLNGSGVGNILTGFSLQASGNVVPGSVTLTASSGPTVYTDPTLNGYLTPTGTGGVNTINYSTGIITIPSQAGSTVTAQFNYYPGLPVEGLEDLVLDPSAFPGTLGFDTKYAYNIQPVAPYNIYSVSFYKNPPVSSALTNYVPKSVSTPVSWNGQDYQQFFTCNYQGALWATNGINIPFTSTNVGMQYKAIVTVTVLSTTTANLQITAHGLVVGDFVFINEVVTTTGINFQTGYVTTVTDANNVIVTFPNATITTNGTGGIAQYLTNRSDVTKDCIRFYDGDPTNGNSTTPTLNGTKGWVNFAPPLSQSLFSIADKTAAQYYLAGARMIVPFKDRLLFIGPVIQTSAAGSQLYLQDTVIYSQNGTPYYTASYTNTPSSTVDTPTSSSNVFFPILLPSTQTSSPAAFFEDVTGFGGFVSSGLDETILTVGQNEDVLIMGLTRSQTRFVYTGNDIVPFSFFVVNSELGSGSTFSTIITDKGILTKGSRGYVITSQVGSQRFDLEIPDQVFEVRLTDNGSERVTAQRDYINEWIYFTYPSNKLTYKFPNQTLQYNYRDDSWAIFNECFTTYGLFRKQTGYTWSTIGTIYPTWASWNDAWNAGSSTLLNPEVIGGNQQGFVLIREEGTNEANSLSIQSFSGNTVTALNHCLSNGDYIVISGCLGTIGSQVNGNIYSVASATTNTFTLNPANITGSPTYFGGGLIKRMYVPFIQTKQFPVAWDMARKTRLGPQQYLFTTTDNSQVTLLIFLSQDGDNAYNNLDYPYNVVIVPQVSENNSLIYSTILYTCPESTNLGLTAANINLQIPTSKQQAQTWHRMNTSLIGDTVQIGITLNDTQMRDTGFAHQFAEIEFHGCILDVNPSQLLV